eukprot:jgi/Ulvmu1/8395/UM042_0102.1
MRWHQPVIQHRSITAAKRVGQRQVHAAAYESQADSKDHILSKRALLLATVGASVSTCRPAVARGVQGDISDGMAQFRMGNVQASIELFDRAMEARPTVKPYLWQRGLSLFYAGRYADAAEQFRADVAVNPNDTEEAIWTYLAEAQLFGATRARDQLLQVGQDPRQYMRQAYAAVSASTSAEVAAATRANSATGPDAFYLALYRGLLLEALGDTTAAAAAVAAARGTEYAQRYARKDYMIALADVHCAQRGSCA